VISGRANGIGATLFNSAGINTRACMALLVVSAIIVNSTLGYTSHLNTLATIANVKSIRANTGYSSDRQSVFNNTFLARPAGIPDFARILASVSYASMH
jgi:hypothetical protein